MNTKKLALKISSGNAYDVFSCPSNDYQGLVQISIDGKESNGVVVSVYSHAYLDGQKGARIAVQPGTSTVVLASRVILDVNSSKGNANVSFEVLGVFPKTS